ncbi:putative kinase domain protein [Rhizoctonia solani 123E]|uniref:Putative kinase domain protein n=1 Tax=Rhizoctonia solani 123E TaxID=1423351 RepID=A0A074RSN0_9AGAM|nr:putative kinase domain protein [Rhizoctonia solani 123E]
MDKYIESELHNAIFHDPNFIDRFLSGDASKLDRVHKECQRLDSNYCNNDQWKLPPVIRTEKSLYSPVLHILNTIKKAVDTVSPPAPINIPPRNRKSDNSNPLTSDDDPSDDFVPEQPMFIDTSRYIIPSDRAETRLIKPDLILFEDVEDNQRHWEHVRMPIEIKKLTGYHKAAMKQLSRYARAVFAHQLHRRHLYTMMVCSTEATFVRFDRAGILYSHRIDIRKDSKAFTYAFASLLMLDRTDQGYDPAFTCEINDYNRLNYYVDLPTSAFETQTSDAGPTVNEEAQIHRFLVVDTLCHRKSISGRATIVLRIRKVEQGGDETEGDEYVLKIMWRDPERGLEGEVLKGVKGKFGLVQHVWHGDAFGKRHCSPKVDGKWQCEQCVAETVQLDELEVCDELTDISIEVPPEEGDKDPELTIVDTSVCRPTSRRRPRRICTFIVMSSKGVPLERAESPRQFVQAVLDAILGYWGLFNIGILHRDISEGNVLMLRPRQHMDRQYHRTNVPEITDEVLIESEKKLRQVLDQLGGREPTGILSDFDLHAMHSPASRGVTPVDARDSVPPNSTESDCVLASCATPPSSSIPQSPRTSGLVRQRQEDTTEDRRESKRRKTHSRRANMPITVIPRFLLVPKMGRTD